MWADVWANGLGFAGVVPAFDPAGGTNTTKDKRQNAEEPNYDKVGRRQRQERTCTGKKYANFGRAKELAFDDENV